MSFWRARQRDIRVFRAEDQGELAGGVVFTRLVYPDDPRNMGLLSPMAVVPARQAQGIGKTLIARALEALRNEGAEVAITCSDPDFYGQARFALITEAQARAPLPLRFPHGWIGQSVVDETMPTLAGKPTCAAALNSADFW